MCRFTSGSEGEARAWGHSTEPVEQSLQALAAQSCLSIAESRAERAQREDCRSGVELLGRDLGYAPSVTIQLGQLDSMAGWAFVGPSVAQQETH